MLIFTYISSSYTHITRMPRKYVERRCLVMRNIIPPVGSFLRKLPPKGSESTHGPYKAGASFRSALGRDTGSSTLPKDHVS